MKKLIITSMVLILLAATAMPALAGDGKPNGHGNGVGNGQGSSADPSTGTAGDKIKDRDRDKDRTKDRLHSETGSVKFRNQENTKWMFTPFYLQGNITNVDAGAQTITVNVVHANAKVKEFVGTDLVIAVNEGTQIFQINQGDGSSGSESLTPTTSSENSDTNDEGSATERVPISFGELAVGQNVAIHGSLLDTVYTARLITVYLGQPVQENP